MALPFLAHYPQDIWLSKLIFEEKPLEFNEYWEPFLLEGAVFFECIDKGKISHLSGYDGYIVNTYRMVARHLNEVCDDLNYYERHHSKQFYDFATRIHRKTKDAVEAASLFIYLNRIQRPDFSEENPFSKKEKKLGEKKIEICNLENLSACSHCLKNSEITICNYNEIEPAPGDFVFIDHKSPRHSEQLVNFCSDLDKKGVLFLLVGTQDAIEINKIPKNFNSEYKNRFYLIRNYTR
jgi:site-specific DNA-adenine methylase